MSSSIELKNHPFRFLLYLEWTLLTTTILFSLFGYQFQRITRFPEVTITTLIIFGLMGLRLPTGNLLDKIFYTFIQVVLIVITGIFGGKTARLFPFLYLILVTRSCLIFQLPGRVFVTLFSFILFLVTLRLRFYRFPTSPVWQDKFRILNLNLSLTFGLTLLFVLLLMNAILAERQSREKLAAAHQKLREYALRVENQATLEERNRIAREIHDSLGHSLTALNLQLETALKLWQSNPNRAYAFLAKAKELGSMSLQDVRHSVSAMRSNPLEEQSLESAILGLAENVQRATGVSPICQINLPHTIPSEISIAVYRIVQESFTNICRYAQATEVKLEIITTHTGLILIIKDNGVGFDLNQNISGFGLQSMRDRTMSLGGELKIEASPSQGCTIVANIPFPGLTITDDQ
jgi:signal transduction histidine kinase